MVDLGAISECSELESKSKNESQTGTILNLKYQFKEKLKKKGEWNHQSHQFSHQ